VSYGKWQIIAKKKIIKIIIVYFNLLFPIIAKKKNTIALEISCLILKKYISVTYHRTHLRLLRFFSLREIIQHKCSFLSRDLSTCIHLWKLIGFGALLQVDRSLERNEHLCWIISLRLKKHNIISNLAINVSN
jgi:hypothetical protein